ncbi:membrane protein [Candidatus Thiomargarita nelsonii]|uniref:Membrane protein n=1 Tax=Candidatus Thiomargarita nelsonii TaxID=1003181 RepID=A0A176RXG6_9GAMM|nr:membrane protein [Candidatus Thiomargarita nelsonii]
MREFALALLLALPLFAFWVAGAPLSWQGPQLKGFNFQGCITVIPEITALLIALGIY